MRVKVNKLYLEVKTRRWDRLSGEEGVKFPLSEAFSFSLESIKRRFGRALVTMLSIVLGISFLTFLLTTGRIVSVLYGEGSGVAVQFYQLWMAIIALLICSVGIVNSMLMSVTERYKEIGTMKCLGAMNTHVLEIFLIEALLLGLIGGGIGAVAGWTIATVWQAFTQASSANIFMISAGLWAEFNPSNPLLLLANPLIAIALSIVISLLAALAPAYIAAKLSPTEALRYEV
jgi:ABC-type antimicrobial peptide transport system permease subunit